VATLRLLEPYAFELSTARYRAFGTDLANLWHEGGLHRVIDGREVRIEAASANSTSMLSTASRSASRRPQADGVGRNSVAPRRSLRQ